MLKPDCGCGVEDWNFEGNIDARFCRRVGDVDGSDVGASECDACSNVGSAVICE